MAEPKKPVKVIKAGDMSPETKALPDEVVKPPKGIGSSEKDMSPIPKKDTSAPPKKAAPKPDYEGEMGYSPEEMAEVEQARKRLAKQGIYKKGGVVKDLKKAGFYDAKKDKAKRLSIINKVTTKPERIEMVDKMFSAKKMAKGGTASSRADGIATKGKTRGKIC
jgi:hypothetical protein